MWVDTSRFGRVRVHEDRILTFPQGLLGFARQRRFALIHPHDGGTFYWLQSTDTADLAFVVTDPFLFVPDYRPPLREDQLRAIELANADAAQVLVMVNRHGSCLTGNLRGPLVVNPQRKLGLQAVLSDARFHTRFRLVDLAAPVRERSCVAV